MYVYTIELTPSKKNVSINYKDYLTILEEARDNINSGLTFLRDGKRIDFEEILPKKVIINLKSAASLKTPTKSLSALTRYLTSNYSDLFSMYVQNQTLFKMNLINTQIDSPSNLNEISDEEMLKALIDLLYGFTAKSVSDSHRRIKTIKEIKELIRPFLSSIQEQTKS
ncbi:hypothetical protein [Anaerobutyricum hallii]|uniref:hypothetical protein n=1 Tax=Anaerobutyricum hallii TaxID=39488 RepID=UPI0024317BAF|nr:hypothetical protein [Anaerobutyricum hallii]